MKYHFRSATLIACTAWLLLAGIFVTGEASMQDEPLPLPPPNNR